jgi:hypothetical protein
MFPILRVSGLYEWRQPLPIPLPGPLPGPGLSAGPEALFPLVREELRLDVDGRYPQMVASGTIYRFFASQTHWVANLTAAGSNVWTGNVWHKDGDVASFPYTNVEIQVTSGPFPTMRIATVTLSGGGGANRVRTLKFKSSYFHPIDFEFDCATGEAATLSVNTHAHPNRPPMLPAENLSIQTVFRRAGFDVTTSPGAPVPIAGAGAGALWSDTEMHDAMQLFWSRFGAKAQWAMWVFFASLHETGNSLGGIMFDDIGPNHRQGTAIFNDSFIAAPPAGDANPAAWVQRMIFWTACHEMGHTFNLAHSWQKASVFMGKGPWIPLANEPEARSFMNYPFRVGGGQAAFFADFEYRFSDGELLFMRHAPPRFVQQGNAEWFDHHGFQQPDLAAEPTLKLELRANREQAIYEFMEPITLELKLTNVSVQPCLVNESLLATPDAMTVILKRDGKPARQFVPYVQYCWQPVKKALMPGESDYQPLFVSAGTNGWDIAEPGTYTVQIALDVDGESVTSNPLRVRVAPPKAYDEEVLAQDFFSNVVGRIVALDGSQSNLLARGNGVLEEVADRLRDRRVALHALVALGRPLTRDYKRLVEDSAAAGKGLRIEVSAAKPDQAHQLLSTVLVDRGRAAVESFGHIDYKWYVDKFSEWLAQQGAVAQAAGAQEALYQILATRQVHGRPILGKVVEEVRQRRDKYLASAATVATQI